MAEYSYVFKAVRCALSVCVIFAFHAYCAAKPKYTEEEKRQVVIKCYENGVTAYQSGNYSLAKSEFDKILKFEPDNNKVRRYADECEEKLKSGNADEYGSISGETMEAPDSAAEIAAGGTAGDKRVEAEGNAAAVNPSGRADVLSKNTGLVDEGVRCYRSGDYGKAKEIFEQAISLDVSNKKAARYLRRCDEKISENKRLMEKESIKRAKTEKEKKNTKKEAPLEKVTADSPKAETPKQYENTSGENILSGEDPDRVYKEALSEYRKQNYGKALELFREVLKKDPDNEKAKMYIKSAARKL
ncbi:MAG: tetratricopeptide repeat protein [bacterium]|nr:tetratricopeptide repeat protein [bacterium]